MPNHSKLNAVFWFHLLITIIAWIGPFAFSWYWIIPVYVIVMVQFIFFKRCFVNAGHAADEGNDYTFYAELLERVGFRPNRKRLKLFVRKLLYLFLSAAALIWQLGLKQEPWFF